ncbi:MAG: hypothetical protein AUG49_18605 [Catenulispora sp. 13_1_20CM_3_70_7]|nr:MAG: hypothetical protein AUG49_18605 [Catenulispora sp. 13_1_20CM_3_70_7]
MTGQLWHVVDFFLDGDPRAPGRLRELRGLLAEDEHPALGFVIGAIEAWLADRRRAAPARCVRHGRGWRIELGTRAVLVEHRVGMLHLAVLTANPGVEISVTELVAGVRSLNRADGRGGMSTQPLLDRTAVQRYRSRLSQLRGEIQDLETTGDPDRAAQARTELDWVLRELAAAAGPGGYSRAFTDDTERARIAVGKAIRRALDQIEYADATVAAHLRAAVHTGVHCWYRPA